MRQAVIVSYARTGLAKAGRGGFNNTSNMTILGHAIEHAVKRSGVDPAEVEDVIAGCVAASGNVARAAALLAGLPVTTSGMAEDGHVRGVVEAQMAAIEDLDACIK